MWYSIKRFFRRLYRLVEYLPLIWKSDDYDYRYAVDLFMYQLDRTGDYILTKGIHENTDNDFSRIRTATNLLKKVYDEEYLLEWIDVIEEKYGPSKIDFIPIEGTDNYQMIEVFEKDYTDSELLEIAEERQILSRVCRVKHERAHRIAWEFIEHNIRYWWD